MLHFIVAGSSGAFAAILGNQQSWACLEVKSTQEFAFGLIPLFIPVTAWTNGGLLNLHQEFDVGLGALHLLKK